MAHVDSWQGTIADSGLAIAALKPTGSYEGAAERFPLASRLDYTEAFRTAGQLGEGVDLAAAPMLAAAAQAHWHASGANACVFAAHLSERRSEYGWETYVITLANDARDLAAAIASIARPRLAEPEVEVVSVLLPELDDESALAAMLSWLAGLTDWEVWEEGEESDDTLGSVVRLGVRAAVEFDHWSEVLGFGRFAAQPSTRLAPFTELAIRAKPPERPRRNQRAYMADIEVDIDRVEFGNWWHRTEEERARRLMPYQDLRGKAKVTFSLRKNIWRETSR